MPRRALIAVCALAVAGLIAASLVHRTARAFTLGVQPGFAAVVLQPGQTGCQQPIDVPAHAAFDRVTVPVGTFFQKGSPLALTVRSASGATLARGRLAGGYPDVGKRPLERIVLDRRVSAPRIAVCVRNEGPRRVALYGNSALAARTSTATRAGQALPYDISFSFERPPRSLASLAGPMAERAALWRFPGMPAWIYLILALAIVVAVPALLVRALGAAIRAS